MAQLSLEQQADLASIAYELGHNPKTRPILAHAVQQINPQRANASFPDVIQAQQFREFEKRLDEKYDFNGAKAAKNKLEQEKSKLKERYSEDEIAKIEQVMDRIGTHSYEAGAVLYAHENPGADPREMPPEAMPGERWEFPTLQGVEFKKFAADPRKHSIDAAKSIITEFKQRTLPSAFRR